VTIIFRERNATDEVEEYVPGPEGEPGCWRKVKGAKAKDIIQSSKARAGTRGVLMRDETHEAISLPSIEHGIDPDVPRYSPEGVKGMLGGHPLFKHGEIDEYVAKKQAKGHTITYDRQK
jgi:hypothetical protein